MGSPVNHSKFPSLLIVAEDPQQTAAVRKSLSGEGFKTQFAGPYDDLDTYLRAAAPVALVFHQSRSALQVEAIMRRLRQFAATASIPLIVLGKDDESDELVAFAMGADDYIAAPLSARLLSARIHALARRGQSDSDSARILRSGVVSLDPQRREVTVLGEGVSLTPTEYILLREALHAEGRVATRARMAEAAFGQRLRPMDRRLDVHMTGLRKKLGVAAACLQTIRGVGYAWRVPDGETQDPPVGCHLQFR
jgi:two-component system phosphate regulon response regulator PhoB